MLSDAEKQDLLNQVNDSPVEQFKNIYQQAKKLISEKGERNNHDPIQSEGGETGNETDRDSSDNNSDQSNSDNDEEENININELPENIQEIARLPLPQSHLRHLHALL